MLHINVNAGQKTMLATYTDGDLDGQCACMLYDVSLETLTLCWVTPGKPCPHEFAAGAGSERVLLHCRRVNQEAYDKTLREIKDIQGTWNCVFKQWRGKTLRAEDMRGVTLVLGKNQFRTNLGRIKYKGSYRLDPTKRPGQMDLELRPGHIWATGNVFISPTWAIQMG
jgi:uncharacterized protein (TIGR03067 family)